jgi:hypothetical protein
VIPIVAVNQIPKVFALDHPIYKPLPGLLDGAFQVSRFNRGFSASAFKILPCNQAEFILPVWFLGVVFYFQVTSQISGTHASYVSYLIRYSSRSLISARAVPTSTIQDLSEGGYQQELEFA